MVGDKVADASGPAGKKRERAGPQEPSPRLFVYNLSWDTSWQDVKDYFSTTGKVVYADVMREGGPEGRSKGCGVVEFETGSEAAAAIAALNGTELKGRTVYCREDLADLRARPQGRGWTGGNKRWRPSGPSGFQWYGEFLPWGRGRIGPEAMGFWDDRMTRHAPGPYFEDAGREWGAREYGGCGGFGGDRYGGRRPATVGTKVFVSNLNFESTWQELKDHFKAAGNVVYVFIKTDESGRSKGCGTVQFESAQEALRAISLLSNSTLGGRQIVVREDRSEWGGGTAGCAAGPGPGTPAFSPQRPRPKGQETAVVIYGLPFSYEAVHLSDFMRSAGPILRAHVGKGPDGNSRGFGTVVFDCVEAAQRAVRMFDGQELHGRIVKVQIEKLG